VSRGALSEVAEPSALSRQHGGSMPGLVWAMLPLRRLSAPLRVLVVGSALLAPMVQWRLTPHETAWLSTSVYQMLLLTVVVCSALVPASPALGERLWPLSVRQVFVMHIAQRVLLGLGPFVLMSLSVWGVRALRVPEGRADGLIGVAGELVGLPWFETAAVLMVACLLPFLSLQSPLAAESESRIRRTRVIVMSSAWLLVALQWLGESWRLLVPATAALLAVPLAWWQWKRAFRPIPSAWCEPGEPPVGATPLDAATPKIERTGSSAREVSFANHTPAAPKMPGTEPGVGDVLWLVWTLSPTRKLVSILALLYATMLGFSTYTGARASVSPAVAVIPVILMFSSTQALSVLPVRPWRRLLLGVLMGPVLATLGIVVGLGLRTAYKPPLDHTSSAPYKEQLAGHWDNPSRIELTYWRWSEAEAPPAVVAPWGERVEPFAARVLGRWLYNPFTVRQESSEAFKAWQWQRLTDAVYGQPVPQQQFSRRDRQHPPMRSERWPVLLLRTAFSFAMMIFLVLPCWHMRIHQSTWRSSLWMAVFVVPMLLPMLLAALVDGLGLGLMSAVTDQFLMALVAQLPSDPLSMAAALALLAVLPALAALGLLYRASRKPMLEFSSRQSFGWGGPRG